MNTQTQDLKKTLRIITIILIGATLLTPFIFSGDFFFPYITSKAFFMRTMIALATTSYIALALIDKNSRPKRSTLLYSVLGFMFILILATLNSVNPTRSLWSNFERMEGLVTMLYMAVLFVISASTIRKNEWSYLMNASLIISVLVGVDALGGTDRISGNLGNSSYLGVYALIHIFFSILGALMIFRGNRERELLESGEHKNTARLNTRHILYIVLFALGAVFNTYILYKTGTRGAFVGLVIGLVLSSMYFVWKEKNKTIKFAAMGFLAAIVLSVTLLGIFKHSAVVQNSNQLSRFAALVTTDYRSVLNNQGYARTMIWKMAFEGVKERPLLGWGQDNFGYVFAKYYNPHMYEQEQWFDRSHNVFMDWLIAGGVFGLLGYLSLFVTALYFIFSKRSKFTIVEQALLLGLLAAYFVHNIFVFDNLSSYVLFFLILAYINDRYTHDRNEKLENKDMSDEQKNKAILIGFISLMIIVSLSYQTILKPFTQNKELINILQGLQENTSKYSLNLLDKNFKNTFELSPNGQFEIFEQMSQILPKVLASEAVSTTTKQNLSSIYIDIVKKYDEEVGGDARYNYFLVNAFKSMGLNDQAYAYADKMYSLSPNKQSFAYTKALMLMEKNDINGVTLLLKKAYEDAPENITAYGYYVGVLSQVAEASGYAAKDIDNMAQVLLDGYTKNKHDIILKKEFWDMFTDIRAKRLLSAKIIEKNPSLQNQISELIK